MAPFKPSEKHILMTREFYKELKADLEKIRTCITAKEAEGHANYILKKLKDKYEGRPGISNKLFQHEQKIGRTPDGQRGLRTLGPDGQELD